MTNDTIKIPDKRNVKMIAHRGLSSIERQNTNAAFVAAANRSYFGIEADIHLTADGKFAVIHDNTTGGVSKTNINVEHSTYDELSQIILHSTENVQRSDLRIPLVGEYLSICKRYGKKSILELKNPMEQKAIESLIKEARVLDCLDNIIFISFSLSNLKLLRSFLPNSKLQYLISKLPENLFDTLSQYRLDADVRYDIASRAFVNKVHSLGLEVNAWTVDKPEIARFVIDNGVDYITTNCLE